MAEDTHNDENTCDMVKPYATGWRPFCADKRATIRI